MTGIYSWAEAMNEIDDLREQLADAQRGRKVAQIEAFRRGGRSRRDDYLA